MTALCQKLIDELDLRGFSSFTVKSYVAVVYRLARHFKRPPDQLHDDELKEYLLHLLRDKHHAAATMTVTVSALRFFYRQVLHRPTEVIEEALPRMRQRTVRPRIYSPKEIERILNAQGLTSKHRVLLLTTYAAGLRVSEVCRLRLQDINSARMQIRVEQGKGHNYAKVEFGGSWPTDFGFVLG